MKDTSHSRISIASASRPSSHDLEADQRLKEPLIPRAAVSLDHHLGFSVASQRLAQRRLATLRQERNLPTAISGAVSSDMSSQLSCLLPQSRTKDSSLPGFSSRVQAQPSDAWPVQTRKIHQYLTLAEADQERSQLTLEDQFEPHDLDELLLDNLRQQLQCYPIVRAELVKKTVRFFPEQPLYVLLVSNQSNWKELVPQQSTLDTQIAQELCFSRELLVCLTDNTVPPLVKRIEAKSTGNLLAQNPASTSQPKP